MENQNVGFFFLNISFPALIDRVWSFQENNLEKIILYLWHYVHDTGQEQHVVEGSLEKDSYSVAFLEMWLVTDAKVSNIKKPSVCGRRVSICVYAIYVLMWLCEKNKDIREIIMLQNL